MKQEFIYQTSPMVCSESIKIAIDGDTLVSAEFRGGCPGNLAAINVLTAGMKITDVIHKLKGISCGGKPTSCSDQLARALEMKLASQK